MKWSHWNGLYITRIEWKPPTQLICAYCVEQNTANGSVMYASYQAPLTDDREDDKETLSGLIKQVETIYLFLWMLINRNVSDTTTQRCIKWCCAKTWINNKIQARLCCPDNCCKGQIPIWGGHNSDTTQCGFYTQSLKPSLLRSCLFGDSAVGRKLIFTRVKVRLGDCRQEDKRQKKNVLITGIRDDNEDLLFNTHASVPVVSQYTFAAESLFLGAVEEGIFMLIAHFLLHGLFSECSAIITCFSLNHLPHHRS